MQNKYMEFLLVIVLVLVYPTIIAHLFADKIIVHNTADTSEGTMTIETNYNDEPILATESIYVLANNDEIISISLEDYLTAVLLCEMPLSFDEEALKAQAVVARTYTLRRQNVSSKHPGAPVCMDPGCCQGYLSVDEYCSRGGNFEEIDKARKAVRDTEGEVLLYNNELIDATYFACSGGMTEDALAVWGADIPYLQSKVSPGEENAKYYSDTKKISIEEFGDILELEKDDHVISIGEVVYTTGGGVASMKICGKSFTGVQIRQMLGLRSTAFEITVLGDQVVIKTMGFGHRVGMSQYGAEAMAVQGKTYEEILLYYYDGVEIKTYLGD